MFRQADMFSSASSSPDIHVMTIVVRGLDVSVFCNIYVLICSFCVHIVQVKKCPNCDLMVCTFPSNRG